LYGGRGPAGVEVYWDGVPYLPLGRDSVYLDLGRISLAPLERVDVLVLPATLRVYLVTARQQSTATASQVRIATGQARTANYRGSYERRWRSGLELGARARPGDVPVSGRGSAVAGRRVRRMDPAAAAHARRRRAARALRELAERRAAPSRSRPRVAARVDCARRHRVGERPRGP